MNRLHLAHRALLYTVLAVLFLTGVAWEAGVAPGLLMEVHGAAAMATLVLLGGLLARHVPAGWTKRANRPTGVLLLAGCGWLVVSGYALYYAGSEALRYYAAITHLWVGIGLAMALIAHRRPQAKCVPQQAPVASDRARSSP